MGEDQCEGPFGGNFDAEITAIIGDDAAVLSQDDDGDLLQRVFIFVDHAATDPCRSFLGKRGERNTCQ